MSWEKRNEHAVSGFAEATSEKSERLWSVSKTMQEEDSMRALLLQIYRLSPTKNGSRVSTLPVVHPTSRWRQLSLHRDRRIPVAVLARIPIAISAKRAWLDQKRHSLSFSDAGRHETTQRQRD